jgi:nickel transport protein
MLCLASSVGAHDYWFEPDAANGDILMFRGHRYSDHEGIALEPYDPSVIESAVCLGEGADAAQEFFDRIYPMRLPAGCAAYFIFLDAGTWIRTPHGIANVSRQASDGAESWKALESVKVIRAWDAQRLTQPISNELDIIPSSDPFALEPGEKIRLRIMLDNHPVAGAAVAYHGNFRGLTDRDGRINIRLRHHGLQVISASIEEPLDSGEADRLVRSAVLQFEMP